MSILAALFVGMLMGWGIATLAGVAAARDHQRLPRAVMCTGVPDMPRCPHLAMPGHTVCREHADCQPLDHGEAQYIYVGGPWDGNVRAFGDPPERVATHGGAYLCDELARCYIWCPED